VKLLKLLAYVTGAINRELLLRNEYLAAENKILRAQIKGRPYLSIEEKKTLAEVAVQLGRKLLAEVATIVTPDTLFAWYRELVAKKFDGSKERLTQGRPPTEEVVESLVLEIARQNRSWGYRRIVGALANLGHSISHQTVANILDRNGLQPAPVRGKGTTWSEFIRTHLKLIAATDFFSVEVLTLHGLVTYYVLFFMHLGTRRVEIAGITDSPNEGWMKQVARNVTMSGDGFLNGCRYLIHDRDTKFSKAFRSSLEGVGIECLTLPAHSPNLNAYAERWVRSVRQECTDKLLFCGEGMLRHALSEFLVHYHAERNHQGLSNALLAPRAEDRIGDACGTVQCGERLGGLLKFYHRAA